MDYLEKRACNGAFDVLVGIGKWIHPLLLIEIWEYGFECRAPHYLYEENNGACRCCGNIVEENEYCPTCGTKNEPL